jgi:hypothetical protein
MGIFDRLKQEFTGIQQSEVRTVIFDSDWQDNMEILRQEILGKKTPTSLSIEIPDAICEEITNALSSHSASERVPYSENKTPINNVGESFRQNELSELCGSKPGDDIGWLFGFLIPEILNPYDKNAVGITAIQLNNEPDENNKKYSAIQVGYMDKESAKKVHKKILNLLGKDQYVPLLIKITGGTKEKPNYGAFPYVMTDKINFE